MSHVEPNLLWVERDILSALGHEPLRIQQRILRSLTALRDGCIQTGESTPHVDAESAWRPLRHPGDGDVERLRGEPLWWRIRGEGVSPDASVEVLPEPDSQPDSQPDSLPDSLPDHERLTSLGSSRFEVRISSYDESAGGSSKRARSQVRSRELVAFNPLTRWVRSPEQAMIRRAMLTQRRSALLIRSAYSAGATSALAATACDWTESNVGECLLVTPSTRRARDMINALSSTPTRVRVIHPSTLILTLLGRGDATPKTSASNEVATQTSRRALETQGLPLISTLYGGRASLVPPPDERRAWEVWAAQNTTRLGPWANDLMGLRRVALHQVLSAGAPHRQDQLIHKPSLQYLPREAREVLSELCASIWESPLGEAHRLLSQRPLDEWPWPEARALLIDSCLELSWPVLYSVLRLADEQLGASGRHWTLALSGFARAESHASEVSWRDLESLVQAGLGRAVYRVQLQMSERLSLPMIRGIRPLYEQLLSMGATPQESSITHALPSGTSPTITEEASTSLPPIMYAPLTSEDSEVETLTALLKTCLATPSAYLLDLHHSPERALQARGLWDSLKQTLDESLHGLAQQRVLKIDDLAEREVQWLIVYQPQPHPHRASTGGALTAPLYWSDSVDELCYLLTRSPTPLMWLGAPPNDRLDLSPPRTLDDITRYISARSPWGGLHMFDRLERAQIFEREGDVPEAIECWRSLREPISVALGATGERRAVIALSGLYHRLIHIQIEQHQWRSLSSSLEALDDLSHAERWIASVSTEETRELMRSLSERSREAHASIHEALNVELERADHALLSRDLGRFVSALSGLRACVNVSAVEVARAQIARRVRGWSERLVDAPIPQAEIQPLLLGLLVDLEPDHPEHQWLLTGYRGAPRVEPLLESAIHYLQLTPTAPSSDQELKRWGLKHLTRWLSYLLELRRVDVPQEITLGELTLGFALVAAREGMWDRAVKLSTGGARSSQTLQKPDGVYDLLESAQSTLAQGWSQELSERFSRRDISELEQQYREGGDLAQLNAHYQQHQASPPVELVRAFELSEALELIRGEWHKLSEGERDYLRRQWESLSALSHTSDVSRRL